MAKFDIKAQINSLKQNADSISALSDSPEQVTLNKNMVQTGTFNGDVFFKSTCQTVHTILNKISEILDKLEPMQKSPAKDFELLTRELETHEKALDTLSLGLTKFFSADKKVNKVQEIIKDAKNIIESAIKNH